jgi:hypothetical protein
VEAAQRQAQRVGRLHVVEDQRVLVEGFDEKGVCTVRRFIAITSVWAASSNP